MTSLADIPLAILAGGLATRLRPITETIPKSLVLLARGRSSSISGFDRPSGWTQVVTVLNTKKLEELLVFIARHPGVQDLGMTKLWKLVYFIDTQALRDLGEPVTGSEFIKYEHGPVPSRGDKHLRKLSKDGAVSSEQVVVGAYRLNSIKALREPDLDVFSREEQRIMHEVCRSQGRKKAAALSKLSHEEPAWHYADKLQKLSPALMAYGACEDEEGL